MSPRRLVERVGRFERYILPSGEIVYYDAEPHRYYGEVKASRSAKGGYSFVRDSKLLGCSTAAKGLPDTADPLIYWGTRLEHAGIAELASGSDDRDWLTDPETIKQALVDAGLTWRQQRDATAQRGTNVHELVFLALASGTRPPSLKDLSAEERAYGQAAMSWWADHDPKPLYAEQVTADFDRGFAGRFDLLCEIDGERLLIDLKTREGGKDRRADHVQLAGYEAANIACGIGESDRQITLVLTPDGEWREAEGQAEISDFLCALEGHRTAAALDKRMRAAGSEAEKELVPA